ncbi:hypothetical protein F404_gp117 [Vibrio phage pVp-1]|uniref:Uncharacterized protein n=1 Tax=Vibrio phage pVp-1 TaxID=1150989 RepID=H6WXK8_9CAUD|nr:hypothetical protein F404_gp117 [Vibrio phage pVp-1]AFB83974.1 hypothetical protein pVp-1_0117 [Vibrio phage pVp-1]
MLKATLTDGIVIEINETGDLCASNYGSDIDDVFGWRVVNKDIRDKVVSYAKGNRFSGLYSDNDPDEPSNIRYIAVRSLEVEEVTRIDKLIKALNDDDLIFCLIEETYC